MFLLNIDQGRGRSENKVHWKNVSWNIDGGWVNVTRRWNIVVLNVMVRDDSSWNNTAMTITATITAAITATDG